MDKKNFKSILLLLSIVVLWFGLIKTYNNVGMIVMFTVASMYLLREIFAEYKKRNQKGANK